MLYKTSLPEEEKYFAVALSSENATKDITGNGSISGYASVFKVVDKHSDIIQPGAFASTIKDHFQHNSIKLLWQHHIDEPIGVIKTIREDDYGLYIEAQLIFAIQRAREAYELIKAGALCSLSIGYNVIKQYTDYEKHCRIIEEVDLWEISIVTFPANTEAKVAAVKNDSQWQHIYLAINKAAEAIRIN